MTSKIRTSARDLNAGRKLALACVAPAALREGVAREAVIAALIAAGAKHVAKPDGEASKAVRAALDYQRSIRDEYIVGRMAARLPSNGSDDERIAAARVVLALPNVKSDKPERRTEVQEKAYTAARVAWHSILKDAGIASTGKGSGNQNGKGTKRKARTPDTSKAGLAPKPTTNPASLPKAKNAGSANSFIAQQAAMLLMYCDKNASVVSNVAKSAVQDFCKAVQPFKDGE